MVRESEELFCKVCNSAVTRAEIRLDKKGHIREKICKPCNSNRMGNISHLLKKGVLRRYQYRKHKKDACVECGFTGHPCQLDVDHINGIHSDNSIHNLQTLCANCHRLKTYKQRWDAGVIIDNVL